MSLPQKNKQTLESTPLLRQQQIEQDQLEFTPQQLKLLKQILLHQQLQQLEQSQQKVSSTKPRSFKTVNSSQPIIFRKKLSTKCYICIFFSIFIFLVLIGVGICLGTVKCHT